MDQHVESTHTTDDVDVLSRVSLFSLLKRKDLKRLAGLTKRHDFAAGDVIIREGERDDRLFVLVGGRVDVIKNLDRKGQRLLQTLSPHTYFGEMALIDDLIRSASVVAKENVSVLSLNQWDLRREIEKYPAMASELLQMLSRRVRAVEESLVRVLGGLLPICAGCKKIRDENGAWVPIEEYISDHSEAEFSHSICPECRKNLYPELESR
jgi:CRP-like cAMP-binding protein